MPIDDGIDFRPTVPSDRQRPQMNRTVLGALIVLLLFAVVLSIWALLFRDDDDANSGDSTVASAGPTPVPVPTSTPTPVPDAVLGTVGEGTQPPAGPTLIPTTVPVGFEACDPSESPSATASYIVDTSTTPLNQRVSPSVSAELAGSFEPGKTGLVFTGDCLVNLEDELVWWQINNGTADVWVASKFVTAR